MTDSTDYSTILDRGVQLRIQAKALEEEAEAMKTEANQLFTIALNISGESKLTHDRGTVTRSLRTRSVIDKGQLAAIMMNDFSISASNIKRIIDKSMKTTEYETITFNTREGNSQ